MIMNGNVDSGSVDSSLVLVDIPVREKKTPAKRTLKEDGSLYLVGVIRGWHTRSCADEDAFVDQE